MSDAVARATWPRRLGRSRNVVTGALIVTLVVTFLANTLSRPGLVVGLLTVNDSAGNHYVLLTANPASARGPIQTPGNPRPGPPPPPPMS